MARFSPYRIVHLQIAHTFELETEPQNYYVVFWWQNIPLGHLWIENTQQEHSGRDWYNDMLQSISPAVSYYASFRGYRPEVNIFDLSKENFRLFLSDLFTTPEINEQVTESLSVVICTRNRSLLLKRCIDSLLANDDQDFELLIVDNAPDSDETRELVSKYPQVVYVNEPRKGLDIARNTGAFAAKGSIIAYTDDDVTVSRNWIWSIKTAFTDKTTLAVTGLVLPLEIATQAQCIFEKYWSFNQGFVPLRFDHAYFLRGLSYGVPTWEIGAGANMAFRREAFELIGWFDERLDVGAAGGSGDTEYWYRVLAKGWNCCYVPAAFVFHEHRRDMRSLKHQLYHYMRGGITALHVQYERYHHEGNRRRIYQGFPQYYLDRIKKRILHGHSSQFSTIFTEIKGWLAGSKYYWQHRQEAPYPANFIPSQIQLPTSIRFHPPVSVVIPFYNQAHYLEESIRSVLGQTYENVQVIVVDDGSTDATLQVARSFPGIHYVRVERVGVAAARNIGVMHSSGEFLVFLDPDNFLYPHAIELNLYYIRLHPSTAFVSGGHYKVHETGEAMLEDVETNGNGYLPLLEGNHIGMEATVMYNRNLFFRYHFDPLLKACEDYDLNLRISRDFPVFSHTFKIAAYRLHGSTLSLNKHLMLRSALKVLDAQKPMLRTVEEVEAYERGRKNWIQYYDVTTKTESQV